MLVTHYRRGRARRRHGCSWSLAVHGSVEFYNVARYALAAKLAHARFAVAISDFGRSQLMTLSASERWPHIHVVRCGVDPRVYVPPARAIGLATGARRSSSSAACSTARGCSLLFEAIAELRAARARRHCDASSATGRRARTSKRRTAASGVSEHVASSGAVGQDDIREHYARADIFCLPSFAEGIPVVAMEAMAMELRS